MRLKQFCRSSSPTRTYVAICYKTDFSGVYFRKFTLPETFDDPHVGGVCTLKDEDVSPSWYFLNVLDPFSCIEDVITYEDYCNIKEVSVD